MKPSWIRRLRLIAKLTATYLTTHLRFFLFGFAISISAIFFLPKVLPLIFPVQPYTIGIVGNYTSTTLPRPIRQEISFGLTNLTADGSATAGAATSWEATDSGKLVRFNLDKNLFWSDGTKFDASQVNYSLKGVTLKKLSLSQIEFSLKEAFAPLPAIVSEPLFKGNFVGLGQNKVVAFKTAGRFVQSLVLENQLTGAKKVYKFYPSEKDALVALRLGAVDQVEGLRTISGVSSDPKYQVSELTKDSTVVAIFFNLNQKFLEEKSTRQALVYALPDTFPYGLTADGPISKSNWAFSDTLKVYTQNNALAKKTLAVASDSASVKLNLITPQALEKTANLVAKAWVEVGVDTRVIVSDLLIPSYDAYITFVDLPPDPDQYALWHSTQKGNISNYRSFRTDRLLEEGRTTLDQKERKKIYDNFQKAITEDVPATFLYYPTLYRVVRK